MNKIVRTVIAATAAILLLAGCSAGSAEAQDAIEPSATPSASVEPSAAPITAKSAPAPSASPSKYGDRTQDEYFLATMDGLWRTAEPSDEKQIAAAHYACEQLAGGAAEKAIVAVVGDTPEAKEDNAAVITYAIDVYCPEFDH